VTAALLKKPVIWIALLIASGLCVFTVLHYFGDAFSVLDLDVTMSRDDAIAAARRIAAEKSLNGSTPATTLTEAVARFDGDAAVQTFIELEGGGKPALKPLIDRPDGFSLYKWRVRLYAPSVEREVQIAFTPDGRPSGFFAKVPEAEPGAALTADAARAIAEATATRDWNVDFRRYRPLTASATTLPGKRVDHEFVYERLLDGAPPIGEGRLRLRMLVAGDRLTQLQRFVHVPEAFGRRYETIRSVNNNIAAAASIAAGLLYGLGGCLVGLIWLMRRHAVRWRPSAKWAGVVAVLIAGSALAAIPGSWYGYDTAKSPSTHVITQVGAALVGGVMTWLLLTVIFATAEGLGCVAFGNHPQLWRTWRAPSAYSRAIWGRTLAGYAWIGFDLAFIALFYFVVQRYLGWWSPSDTLIDPNILGTPLPWLSPVSNALQAGMMEEALFRAVPLACAALLGRHFGREKLFIVVALVLQAVIFGCAHANYPGQPAYARPIELFVPALVWGVVYLRYGLVPGMLFHFGFDLVLMSLPLFVTEVPGVGFDRAMVVGILALPLIVLTVQRLRAGRLIDLPDSERNAAAGPESEAVKPEEVIATVVEQPASAPSPVHGLRTARANVLLVVIAAIGLVGVGLRVTQPNDVPGLAVSRGEAIAIAERTLAERGVTFDARWHRTAKAFGGGDDSWNTFVWREGGSDLFHRLMGRTLAPPHWKVRFARFDGDVADRDTWVVSVVDGRPPPDGVRLIDHDVPEARPGKRLTEAEARPIAEAAIASWLRTSATSLRPVSAEATERPARVDWLFIYADPSVAMPADGEARIGVEIDGDEVTGVGRSVFVPEAWSRTQRRRNELLIIPKALFGLLVAAFGIATMVSAVRRLARGEASKRAAWVIAILVVVSSLVTALLDFNATEFGFTVSEPYDNQLLSFGLRWIGVAAAGALIGALVAAVGVRIASRSEEPAPQSATRRQRWGAAIALALLIAGAGGYASLLGASSAPRMPAVGQADSLMPFVDAFVGSVDFTGTAAAVLIAAAVLSTRRRRIEIALAIGFAAAAALNRASLPEVGIVMIVGAALAGLVAWWLFRTQLRDRPGVIAPMLLCLAVLGLVPALARPAYPGAIVATLCSLAGTLLGYALWRWLVKGDERAA
jgi:hypothetical protein